jgi:hypothetical protein
MLLGTALARPPLGSSGLVPAERSVAEGTGRSGSGTTAKNMAAGARVFISYKRDALPDQEVAVRLYNALSEVADPFIDQTIEIGSRWAERIEEEVRRADFLVVLLSACSVQSEMVLQEVESAHHLGKANGGKPVILPVRVAYRESFLYPLSAYLNPIQWALWEGPQDTARLVAEISKAVLGGDLSYRTRSEKEGLVAQGDYCEFRPPTACAQLETPEGTMSPESGFYVERESDGIARRALERQGVTLTIKGARQMGKSSLLVRLLEGVTDRRKVFLDFQLFDRSALDDADAFYPQFCSWLTEELELPDKVAEYWELPLGNSQRCTRYVQRYLLKEARDPLLLAMDEVDAILDSSFRADFFSMLRSWHNGRATSPAWRRLDLALVISTEPYQLIDNLNQSPFNVGEVVELEDFAPEQVVELNARHGVPFRGRDLDRLIALLGGHPFLTRRALYVVRSGQDTVDELFARASDERGPFGDHLRHHMFRLQRRPELLDCLSSVLRSGRCRDEITFFRLRGAGLVTRRNGRETARCQLYEDYFRAALDV